MMEVLKWVPLVMIIGALMYAGWVYIQYLYHLEKNRLYLVVRWNDGKTSLIEIQSLLEAQETVNHFIFSHIASAYVTHDNAVIGTMNTGGVFEWH